MRKTFGECLEDIGDDENIVVIDGDLGKSTKVDRFAKKYPERFFNMGICEQDMVGFASGLALSGKVPFVVTYASFLTGRAFEQIMCSIAMQKANVILIGSHGGIASGHDGITHQAITDIALMRSVPDMVVISPADDNQIKSVMKKITDIKSPVYLRLSRAESKPVTKGDSEFLVGKSDIIKEGSDVSIIATGIMVSKAVGAAKLLDKKGVSASVINISTIKPIDKEIIIKESEKTGLIITAEDHSIIGGIGSAVSDVIAENGLNTKVVKIGINDTFAESGSAEDLLKKYGLDPDSIADRVMREIDSNDK